MIERKEKQGKAQGDVNDRNQGRWKRECKGERKNKWGRRKGWKTRKEKGGEREGVEKSRKRKNKGEMKEQQRKRGRVCEEEIKEQMNR